MARHSHVTAGRVRARSERIFERLRNPDLSDTQRLRLFKQLLSLAHGFWQRPTDTTPMSLRAFMLRVADGVKKAAILQGARVDALDSEGLAHDVLLAFFMNTRKITSNPRAWLIGTAIRMMRSELRRGGPVVFGDELDAGGIDAAQPETPPPEGGAASPTIRKLHEAHDVSAWAAS